MLLELYRIYLYQVSGRFSTSVVNFSQGVRYFDRNTNERGDRTLAEALEVIGSRIAPVLIAVGDGPEFGISPWAQTPSVIPVVGTRPNGEGIIANSAQPQQGKAPWSVVLHAPGGPQPGALGNADASCGTGAHLTADQMLRPESALVPPPGGSSYATFKAASNICYIHQYFELLRIQLRARTPIGSVEVEPFVSYYVDSPVDSSCPDMRYRWADKRMQFGAPQYAVTIQDKVRLDAFVHGNSIELRPNYSIPLLKAFLRKLPMAPAAEVGPKIGTSGLVGVCTVPY